MYKLIYPESYIKKASKFIKRHPEIRNQYQKALELLELNPFHPALRLHKLQGQLEGLSSVSINYTYRIVLQFLIQGDEILLIDIGTHDQVY